MTRFWSDLLPGMPAACAYTVTPYGPELARNKAALAAACREAGATPDQAALFLAMAMIETTLLSPEQRDASKDGRADGSENVSIFNLSVDLVRRLGWCGDPRALNAASQLPAVLRLLARGASSWGVERLLDYVRGGYTAFVDGTSYGARDYRDTVATVLRVLDAQPQLFSDDRRVNVELAHV